MERDLDTAVDCPQPNLTHNELATKTADLLLRILRRDECVPPLRPVQLPESEPRIQPPAETHSERPPQPDPAPPSVDDPPQVVLEVCYGHTCAATHGILQLPDTIGDIELSARGSRDKEGPVTYSWFINGRLVSLEKEFPFPASVLVEGDNQVLLAVADSSLQQRSAGITITVLPASSDLPPEVMPGEPVEEPVAQDPPAEEAPTAEEATPDASTRPSVSTSTALWTHTRRDPQRSGYAANEDVLQPPLRVDWTAGSVTSLAPIVSEGIAVARTGSSMTAWKVDGSIAWVAESAGRPDASDRKRVYLTSIGHVVARTLDTGVEAWDDYSTSLPSGGYLIVTDEAVVTGNRILDPSTGSSAGELAAMACFDRRRAIQGTLVYSISLRSLYACSLADEIVWEQNVGGGTLWPVVAGGSVFVYGPAGITELDQATGAVRVQHSLPARVRVPFAADGRFLYVADDDRTVTAYATGDLETVWRVNVEGRPVSPVTVANGNVYLVTSIGFGRSLLVALDSDTGNEVWSYPLAYSTAIGSPEPVVASGRLWLVSGTCGSGCTLTVFISDG